MKKTTIISILTLLPALVFGCRDMNNDPPPAPGGRTEEPGPGPGPGGEVPEGAIELTIREERRNNITVEDKGDGLFEITPTGGDPYFFFDVPGEYTVDIDKQYMLAFDSYNGSNGTLPLVLFVGQENGDYALEGGDYELPQTQGWTNVSYNISRTPVKPNNPRFIRIRFGNGAAASFMIRNPVLREPTQEEIDRENEREQKELDDAAFAERLTAYLDKTFPSKITAVKGSYLQSSQIGIEGQYTGTDPDAGLVEIPMWADPTNLTEVAFFEPVSPGSFSMQFPRFADDGHDRILSGWAVARKSGATYQLLSPMHYATDLEPANPALPKTVPDNIKGIGGIPFDHPDLDELGIRAATFNIILNQILFTEEGAGSHIYEYGGKKYYYTPGSGAIQTIDRDVLRCYERGIVVSAILLIPTGIGYNPDSWTGIVAHPDNESSAAWSMPNMLSAEAVHAYAATMNFLAERYSGSGHGRIHHWIVHNEIQAGYYWTNAGVKRVETYMNLYQKSMRLVYTMARLHDPNAKALISMTQHWDIRTGSRDYSGKECLNLLGKFSRQEGDFEWGIAFHPYPQNIENPRTWEDDQATYSFDTPYITPRNLEVINDWASLPHMLYNGIDPREIQFSEQGLSSPSYGETDLRDQAAGLAYTFGKFAGGRLGNVTAYQYHIWSDYHSGNLRLGLRKYADYAEDPLGIKPIYDVYKTYLTPGYDAVADRYKTVVGLEGSQPWSAVQGPDKITAGTIR